MIKPTILLIIEVVAIYAMIWITGWWLTSATRLKNPEMALPLSAVGGIVILQAAAWCVSSFDAGLAGLWWPLLITSAIAGCVVFAVHVRRVGWSVRSSLPDIRRSQADVVSFVGSLVVTVITFDDLLARGLLSIASPNNDVAVYNAVSDHLAHSGFDSAGTISGVHLGRVARTDVFGAYAYLSGASSVLGRLGFQVSLAAMAVASILVAQSLGRLLARWTSLPGVIIGLFAVVPQCTFLFVYIESMYFLSQLLGVVFAVTMTDLATRKWRGWRSSVAPCVHISVMAIGLVMTYPHMAFLLPPVLVLAVVVVNRHSLQSALSATVAFAVAVVAGLIAAAPRSIEAVRRLVYLNSVVAGWPLDGILPWGLVGQQDGFEQTVTWVSVLGSAALILVGGLAAWAMVCRQGENWAAVAVSVAAAILGSYACFYFLRGGPTYEQWKWIAFLQPLFVVSLLAPLVVLLYQRLGRHGTTAVVLIIMVMSISALRNAVPTSSDTGRSTNWVSLDLATLGSSPALRDVDAVNIQLTPYWESMWAANAVAPRTAFIQAETYYAPANPDAHWTLIRRPAVLPDTRQELRSVGDTYLLVSKPTGPTSAQADSLSAQIVLISAEVNETAGVLQVTLRVTNTGTGAWLPSGRSLGAVNLGASIVGTDGTILELDFHRDVVSAAPFVVAPEDSVTVVISLPDPPTGSRLIRFDLVAEGVAWFSDIGASKPVVVDFDRL